MWQMRKDKIRFELDPQPGEDVYFLREFRGSHGHIFAFAVSNQALYVPQQKLALKNDGWRFKRVPMNEVKEVSLVRQKRIYLLGLSILMIAFGAIVSSLMMWRALNPMPGVGFHMSGWPMAIAIGGIIIPFIAKDRTILLVKLQRGDFKWKPQLSVDKKTREICARLQNEILQACKQAGISSPQP
jgi:hypothetical protein